MTKTESKDRKDGIAKFHQAWRVMMWAIGIYVAIVSAILGWTATTIISHEVRLATIEGNRWTSADAALQSQHITEVLTNLQRDFATVVARLPAQFPPKETRETLRELDRRLDMMERQIIRNHGE